jgi:hypothetical protein
MRNATSDLRVQGADPTVPVTLKAATEVPFRTPLPFPRLPARAGGFYVRAPVLITSPPRTIGHIAGSMAGVLQKACMMQYPYIYSASLEGHDPSVGL